MSSSLGYDQLEHFKGQDAALDHLGITSGTSLWRLGWIDGVAVRPKVTSTETMGKKRKAYQPNAQELRSNKANLETLPLLTRALEAFQARHYREDDSTRQPQPFVWIDDSRRQLELEMECRRDDCKGDQKVDWIALERMKRVVRPKFCKLGDEDTQQGLHDWMLQRRCEFSRSVWKDSQE